MQFGGDVERTKIEQTDTNKPKWNQILDFDRNNEEISADFEIFNSAGKNPVLIAQATLDLKQYFTKCGTYAYKDMDKELKDSKGKVLGVLKLCIEFWQGKSKTKTNDSK